MAVMVRQIEWMAAYKGDYVAFREARKHCGWYMSGIRGAAALRRRAGTIQNLEDVRELAQEAVRLAASQGNDVDGG